MQEKSRGLDNEKEYTDSTRPADTSEYPAWMRGVNANALQEEINAELTAPSDAIMPSIGTPVSSSKEDIPSWLTEGIASAPESAPAPTETIFDSRDEARGEPKMPNPPKAPAHRPPRREPKKDQSEEPKDEKVPTNNSRPPRRPKKETPENAEE